MEAKYIKCEVEKGMFKNESYVSFDTGYGRVETLALSSLVVDGKLKVRKNEETEDDFIVFVPGDIVKGSNYTAIKKSLIEIVN